MPRREGRTSEIGVKMWARTKSRYAMFNEFLNVSGCSQFPRLDSRFTLQTTRLGIHGLPLLCGWAIAWLARFSQPTIEFLLPFFVFGNRINRD
jgi:hypothetical protein